IHPWFDLLERVAGGNAQVSRLLPAGASPHDFDPTPRDAIAVADADLIVYNGGPGLDEWVVTLLAASDVDPVVVAVTDLIEFTPRGTVSHDHDHGEGYVNPHIWLDPNLASEAVHALADL